MINHSQFVQEIPDILRLAASKIEEDKTDTAVWILKRAAEQLEQEIDSDSKARLTG